MHCANCETTVQRALATVPGVEQVEVPDWRQGKATVQLGEGADTAPILSALKQVGYPGAINSTAAPLINPATISSGDHDFDLLVIGAGSAGFAAAIKGVDLGFRVGLVGYGALGGTCVNIGCVPSKTLIRAAEAWHSVGHHPFNGITTQQVGIDWPAVKAQKDSLVATMRQTKYADVLAAYPAITYLEGQAAFQPDGALNVGGQTYSAAKYVIATGARPFMAAIPGLEQAAPLNSTTLMELDELPESLIILGGRAIALELGQTMARLGVRVSILQRSASLVPDHEPEIGKAIQAFLEQEGLSVITGVDISRVEIRDDQRVVHTTLNEEEKEFVADQILVAWGRQPNTEALGLENVGVETTGAGAITVNEFMQSTNPSIFAAGDVTPLPEYVYVAASSAALAAQNALSGDATALDLTAMPGVIFSDPQIATVGLTEAQSRAQGYAVKTSLLDLEHVARARAAHDTRGFIKLVADESSDRLLGAHILAAEAGEVIQSAVLAIKFGITLRELTGTLFPYLTQVEGLKLAAQAFDKDVALLSCCAG
ncbi:MAG: mercury(II) reductase [Chloroflexi bacterium]|nr:mercury(II) reductase [Chloroflexota bacterium]